MHLKDGEEIEPDSWWQFEPCFEPGKKYVAIGWLEGVPIPTGEVPVNFSDKLTCLVETRRANMMRGYHICTYCPDTDTEFVVETLEGRALHLGSAEIWVLGNDDTVFCAPNLIVHYVRDHGYKPPDDFVDAVMRCADAPGD